MTLTGADVLRQNTAGYSEGRPVGVPTSYEWYDGVFQPTAAAPAGFTSVTAWGQVYQEAGEAAYANPQAMVEVANAKTYVHLRETGEWVLVQNQVSTPIAGGHYVADFAGNSAAAMSVSTGSDGRAAFAAPPDGYNNHFWPSARGHYPANAVDAVYVQMDMRVNDPHLNLVANIGADWWRDASAPFVAGFGNNPGAGMNNWAELTTQWKTLAFTSSNTILAADPPPPLEGGVVDPPPVSTIDVPPVIEPDPSALTDGSLLINGSFEATPTASGHWSAFDAIPGWHAVSGGKIELWNNLNGVNATNGQNFGELDFLSARDGLYQYVETSADQHYVLSFDARQRPGTSATTNSIEVVWNDEVVATTAPSAGGWNTHTLSVTGTGGMDRLTLREVGSQSADGLGALYDNVSLVANGAQGSNAAATHESSIATINGQPDALALSITEDVFRWPIS